MAPASLAPQIVDIGSLDLYNQDRDESNPKPDSWVAFRDTVRAMDGVLFVTPEYNRSVPGVLKNAIDVGSRPYGQSVFSGKPCAVMTVSPGALGAFGANHHIRSSFVFLDMPCMQQPEAYINNAGNIFGADGTVTDEVKRGLFEKFITAFAAWVEKHAK
jgi:chromate reductase